MKKIYRYLLLFPLVFCFLAIVWGAGAGPDDFMVQQIRVEGNRGVSTGTVLNYLPIHVGEEYTDAKSAAIIESLYQSGFFTNVNLSRSGNTLIVSVAERPTIASVKVNGNSAINKDDMQKILKASGFTVGNIYSQASLNELKQAMQTQYYSMGYYASKIDVDVRNLPRDRVSVNINVTANRVTKVEEINFIGNHAFSSGKLRRQMILSTPKLWSFITKDDQYSREKLDASLQNITSYYMNRGYIHFQIISATTHLSSDKRHIIITIVVSEGAQYRFSGVSFSGKTIVPPAKLEKLVTFENGQVFSREKVQSTEKAVDLALGDLGFAFNRIQPIPKIDENAKTVFINFHITAGKKVYIRRIIFRGNTVTADYVLRRSMQQMEGSLLSLRNVEESVRKLKLLGFFKNVNVQTVPVPGTNNQVDLIYNVTEAAAGQAMVSVGYGTLGWQFGAGITQPNFLGTGKTVGVNFTTSTYMTSYSINYFNPYDTLNNIGKGITLFYTTTSPNNLNLAGGYSFDTYGGNIYYSIPITLNNTATVGYGLSHIDLHTYGCSPSQQASGKCTPPSTQVLNFINQYGSSFNEFTLNSGWQYLGLDQTIFPTEGLTASLNGEASVPVFKDTLDYYKVGSGAEYFLPLNRAHSFILDFRADVAYGNGYGSTNGLPFFLNYYAGGLSQGLVRGFETNTLGPKDSNNQSIGGNFLTTEGVSLISPNFISPDNLRTSIFFDAGNVYQTNQGLYTRAPGPIRMSAGMAVAWRSPVGPLEFSLGTPVNKQPGDESQIFQFTMGTSF